MRRFDRRASLDSKKTSRTKKSESRRKLRIETLERRELLTTFYVDGANGNDANDGESLGAAFATIQAGADAAMPGDQVLIRGGTYREKVTVPRSGTSTNPITFSPYNGENVVISGGDLVTGWTQHSGDVWVATANWNAGNNRNNNTLFVNGVLAEEGRQHAENDFFDIDDWGRLKRGRLANHANSFTVDDLGGFANDFWNGAKIKFHTHDWIIETRTITDFDAATGRITFDSPVGVISQKQDNGYYIYDALQTVDKEGEWYKQDGGNQLYYQAAPGQNPNGLQIEFKNRDFAFDISGKSNIHLQDFEFRGVSVQTSSASDNNVLEGNRFYAYDKGNFGRFIVNGDNNVIRDNEFSNTWSSFVTVGGVRNEVVNNYVHHIGYEGTTRAISANGAEELLVSHNTIDTFARSFMDGYPTRSEIAYNVFDNGGQLSWDTGVFDADGGNGNSSYSIFHHNVFRNTSTRGIFEGFYGQNSNSVIHHNLIYDFDGANRTVFRSYGLDFRQAHHNTFITDLAGMPSGSLDATQAIQTRYNNNIQISLERMEALGVDVRGNYNYSTSDFVNYFNDDFRLAAGSPAIDTGILLPGINDNYSGAAPDPGAFEFGQPAWVAGHNFVNEPNPVYSGQALPGSNLYSNGQFLNGMGDWNITSGTPNSVDRNSWNLGSSGASLTGTFRTQSIEFAHGDSISRSFTGLSPDTTYTLGVAARVANRVADANQYNGSSGSISSGTHRNEGYVTSVDPGDWVRYDGVDFGELGTFDQLDILHMRNPAAGFTLPIDGISIQVRLDSSTGPLLAEFNNLTDGVTDDRWRADRVNFESISGTHSLYLSTSGSNGGNLAIGSLRLLKQAPPTSDLLSVSINSTGAGSVSAQVGLEDWQSGYEEITFKTGPSATNAVVKFENNGRLNAYLDRIYLIEGYATRGQEPRDLTANATAERSLSPDTSTATSGVLDSNAYNLNQTGDHANSWILVDLGETAPLYSIKLSPANSAPAKLSNFRVSVWSEDPRSGGVELWNQDYLTDDQSLSTSKSLFIQSDAFGNDGSTQLRDVSGRFVQIQLLGENNDGTHELALGEIQIKGLDENNLAITDGTATQSSTAAGLAASHAIDGDRSTRSETNSAASNSWWQVRFPQPFSIGEIELFNHDGANFAELSNFTVSVWDEDPAAGGVKIWEKSYFSSGSVGQGESLVIGGGEIGADGMTRLATAHRGRVVRVQLNGTNTQGNGRLSLADVRVTASNNVPPIRNLAQAGIADQSLDFYGDQATGGFAKDANDGVIIPITNFTTADIPGATWWEVDLQRNTQIDQIVLFNRTDVAHRLGNFTVSVWNDDPDNGGTQLWDRTYTYSGSAPYYSTNNIGAGGALLINGNVTDGGVRLDSIDNARFVRVNLNNNELLSLAEVQVWSNDAASGTNTNVDLLATQYEYDFGTPVSPVGSGTTRISPISSGDISWSAPVGARDAGATSGVSAIDQDVVHSTRQRTLHHRLAEAVWEITVTMGELGQLHDNMRVYAEGKLLNLTDANNVNSAANGFVDVTGLVEVRDGVLDLTFESLGGEDPDWVVSALEINQFADANYRLVDLDQTSYSYDAGTSSSALEAGYERLSDLTHGEIFWTGAVQSEDRATGDALLQDFTYGSSTALEHPLANGIWDVTITTGDINTARDNLEVSAEGILQFADIDSAAGQFVENTFRVEVTDGLLNLQLTDTGGSSAEWALNHLALNKVSDPRIAPADFNADQEVNEIDLAQWQSEYGTSGGADANLDRLVSGTDFLIWQRLQGAGATTTTTLIDASTNNGSFEDQTGASGDGVIPPHRVFSNNGTATIPGWTVQNTGVSGWDGLFSGAASHGDAYAFAIGGVTGTYTSDPVSHTTAVNDKFDVTLDVGNNGGTHSYEIRLRFGATTRVLGSFSDSTDISGGTLSNQSFSYTAVAADAGFNPVVEIVMTNNSGISQSFFDNVGLDVTTTALPPSQAIAAIEAEPLTTADLHSAAPLVAQPELAAAVEPSLVPLALPSHLPQQFTTAVDYAGQTLTLQLDKSTVFGENTKFFVDYGDGELVQIDHGIDRSYLGTVAEYPQYAVSAILTPEGLRASVIRPGQASLLIEPVAIGLTNATALTAGGTVHQVSVDEAPPASYDHDHDGDGIPDHAPEDHVDEFDGGHPPDCACAACCARASSGDSDLPAALATLPPTRTIDVREYEVGVEISSAALNNNYSGSTTQAKVDHAMSVAQGIPGNLDARFLRAAGIKHVIGTVIIRTTSDPITVSNGNDNAGLNAFRNYWNNLQANEGIAPTHDLAVYHVRSAPSGLAYVNSVGGDFRYALSASNGPTSWADGTLAHEFGHSWNLGHVPSGTTSSASFYEARPRSNGNSAGGDNNFISIMHGSGTHNIGRLSTGEANRVLNAKSSKLSFGNPVSPGPVGPYGWVDSVSTNGSPVTIDVIANDHDANNDVLDAQLRDTVSLLGGTISLSQDTGPGGRNEIIYTPPTGVNGLDFFHYTVVDSTGRTDWGTVYVNIDGPVVIDPSQTVYNYDLGEEPVLAGWTKLSPAVLGDVNWTGSVSSIDRGPLSGVNDINRDFVTSNSVATLNHKLPNGVWLVTMNMGDATQARNNMSVTIEGQVIDADIDSPAGQFTYVNDDGTSSGTPSDFQVTVTDGELNIEVDAAGSGGWAWTRLSLRQLAEAPVTVDLNRVEYRYDLGTLGSPVQDATYERLTDTVSGDIFWTGSIDAADRGTAGGANDINRDLIHSTNGNSAVLEHKIADGIWQVLVNIGDADNTRDNVGVRAEGTTYLTDIDRPAGVFNPNEIFQVPVEDGGLTLEFFDLGGINPDWSVTRIWLTRIGDLPDPIAAGDFDANQVVEDDDLVIWQTAYGVDEEADGDGDLDSDGTDFLSWQRNYGVGVQTTTNLLNTSAGNGSFEDQTGATGQTVIPAQNRVFSNNGTATIPGWTLQTTGIAGWDGLLGDASSHGSAYAFAVAGGTGTYTSDVVTSHTTAEHDEFTVTFDVGTNGGTHTYEARLRFGGATRILGSINDSTNIAGGTLARHTFTYKATAADAGFSPALEILMTNNSSISQSFFDNVRLDITTTVLPSTPPSVAATTEAPPLEQPYFEETFDPPAVVAPTFLPAGTQLLTSPPTADEPVALVKENVEFGPRTVGPLEIGLNAAHLVSDAYTTYGLQDDTTELQQAAEDEDFEDAFDAALEAFLDPQ